MKKHLLLLALAVVSITAGAQNSAIFKVDELIEKGRLGEAAALCDQIIANPKTTKFQEIYNKAGQIQIMNFSPELIKASQNLPFDTLTFCSGLDRAVNYYTKSYEATQGVDAKGKPLKSDAKIAADTQNRLLAMVDFYNYSAMFCYANGDKDKALEYFQKYVDYPQNPALSQAARDSLMQINRENYAQTRYNLCMLYYQNKNWDALIANAPAALQDHYNNHDVYVALENAYLDKGDSVMWEKTLIEAATLEGDAGFSDELIGYYYRNHLKEKATKLVNDMAAQRPNDAMTWYIKGCVENDLNNDIPAAREAYKHCLTLDPKFVRANINMGVTYNNEISQRAANHEFDNANRGMYSRDTRDVFMKETRIIRDLYLETCKYFEAARAAAPDQPKEWARKLQGVYNHLRLLHENLDEKTTAAEFQSKYDEITAVCDAM